MCLKHNKNKYTLKYSVMSCLSYSWGWFGCWCLFFTSKKWWLQNDPVTENCLPLVSQQWFNSKGSRLVEIAEEILSWFDCLWCCKIILLPHPPPITLLPLHVIKDIYKRTSHREQPQISGQFCFYRQQIKTTASPSLFTFPTSYSAAHKTLAISDQQNRDKPC